jgi:hypothetical protein
MLNERDSKEEEMANTIEELQNELKTEREAA